jgi:hypothetical protein
MSTTISYVWFDAMKMINFERHIDTSKEEEEKEEEEKEEEGEEENNKIFHWFVKQSIIVFFVCLFVCLFSLAKVKRNKKERENLVRQKRLVFVWLSLYVSILKSKWTGLNTDGIHSFACLHEFILLFIKDKEKKGENKGTFYRFNFNCEQTEKVSEKVGARKKAMIERSVFERWIRTESRKENETDNREIKTCVSFTQSDIEMHQKKNLKTNSRSNLRDKCWKAEQK